MIFSTRYSYIILRLTMAVVFFWFGVDKFIHPNFWMSTYLPTWMISLSESIGLGAMQLVYIFGILEVLTGLSLITGVLIKLFCIFGIVLFLFTIFSLNFDESSIRNIVLLGVLVAIFLWPESTDLTR